LPSRWPNLTGNWLRQGEASEQSGAVGVTTPSPEGGVGKLKYFQFPVGWGYA